MRHLDLFSGIGGFALAARWMGWETVQFVEREPFCQAVLRKHWPAVPCHDDVQTFDGGPFRGRIDLITGGFPCQDLSYAGSGAGLEGDRSGLWTELARIVGEVRPRYVVVENVPALLKRGMGTVVGDLAAIGYDAEWSVVSACAMGAPHMRRRLFIVAYPNCEHGRPRLWDSLARAFRQVQEVNEVTGARVRWAQRVEDQSAAAGSDDGFSGWLDRNRGVGNAIVPQIALEIFRAIAQADAGIAA